MFDERCRQLSVEPLSVANGAAVLAIRQEELKHHCVFCGDLRRTMASLSRTLIKLDRAELSLSGRYDLVIWYALEMRPNC